MTDAAAAAADAVAPPADKVEAVEEQQQEGAAAAEQAVDAPPPFTVYVVLSEKRKLALPSQPQDTAQEIRLLLSELKDTCHLTSYHLEFNGVPIPDHAQLAEVEGLAHGAELRIVEDPYTELSARVHVDRFRHMTGLLAGAASTASLHANASVSVYLRRLAADGSDGAPLAVPTAGGAPASLAAIFDVTGGDLSPKVTPAVGSVSFSAWNPPPPSRRLLGDLLYLDIVTSSGSRLGVTATVNGFHVNGMSSDTSSFAPGPRAQHALRATTLAGLMALADSGFTAALESLQTSAAARSPFEHMQAPFTLPLWAAPRVQHTRSTTRAEAFARVSGADADTPGQLRDWNDEYQGVRALPNATLEDRIVRQRALAAMHADFVRTATAVAVEIVEGNVPTLTPGEPPAGRLFLHSNILFSFGGEKGSELAADLGGVRAVRTSVSRDITAAAVIDALDVEGLCTIRTAAIDYRGHHVIAQSVVPGILKRDKANLVEHGSVDHGATIRVDPEIDALLAKATSQLSVGPVTVLDAEGKEHTLAASVDVKGIHASDGRRYVVDLYRMTPVDVNFVEENKEGQQEEEEVKEDKPNALPLLRLEFVSAFHESKAYAWLRERVREAEEKKKAKEGEAPKEGEAAKEGEEVAKADEGTKEEEEEAIPPFSLRMNPDCFTAANVVDPDGSQAALIREMATFMNDVVIPALVNDFTSLAVAPLDSIALRNAMHSRGINMRYLGRIAELLPKGHPTRDLVVAEMVTRAAKHILREKLVDTEMALQAEGVAHFFNVLLGGDAQAPKETPAATDKKQQGAAAGADGKQQQQKGKNNNNNNKGKKSHATSKKKTASSSSSSNMSAPLIDTKRSALAALTRAALWEAVVADVRASYRYEVSVDEARATVCPFAVVRSLCLAVGVQVLSRDYDFNLQTPFTVDDINGFFPVATHAGPTIDEARELIEAARKAALQGDLANASALLTDGISLYQAVHGPLHEDVAAATAMLATLQHSAEDRAGALAHQERAVLISERVLGVDDPETLRNVCNLAYMHHSAGNARQALELMRHADALRAVIRGSRGAHPQQSYADANIGLMLQEIGESARAVDFHQAAADANRTLFGADSTAAASSVHLLARANAEAGRFREALDGERAAFLVFKDKFGPTDPRTREAEALLTVFTERAVLTERGKRMQQIIRQTAGQFAPQMSDAATTGTARSSATAAARRRR